MAFLGGLFERKAANSSGSNGGAAVSRAISQSPGRYGMLSSVGSWDIDKAIGDAYERDLWVYRCVDAIATNQSRIPIVHRMGDARTGTIKQSPRLHTLLNVRPNIYETAQQMRYRLSAISLLSRKGAFIEVVGGIENPESLHLLPPQSVEPVPHPTRFVEGYWVLGQGFTRTWLKPEQVIWVKIKPHPIDPYQQMTPLVAAGLSVETDLLARLFNRNFLNNDGRPGLLVTVRGQMSPGDAEEIKRRFGGGASQAGQTTVIEGDGMDVADLGATPRDAQWQESLSTSKEDILLAFGVPESILGNASGRTFDNADAEYENFWTHTMLPHCDALAASLDPFTGDLTDADVLAYDYSTVDVLQRQERRRQDAIIDRYLKGVITWNEMREEIGLDSWSEPLAARIIVMASGLAFGKTGEDTAGITKIPSVGGGADPGDSMKAIAAAGAEMGARKGSRQLGNVLAARALQLAGKSAIMDAALFDTEGDAVPLAESKTADIIDAVVVAPYFDERKTAEDQIDGLLISLSSRQAGVITQRLTHAKALQHTRHWVGEDKAGNKPLDPYYAVETERWISEVRDDFERILGPLLKREAKRVAADMDDNSLARPHVGEQAIITRDTLSDVLDIVEQSVRNQSDRIAKKVQQMDEDGASMADIKAEVAKLIGTRSSWRKSLREHVVGSALEGVRHDIYETAGPKLKKTWNSENDDRVRHSHKKMDQKTVKMTDNFEVGQTLMRFPHDPLAPPEEVVNCRCWLTYSM